MAAELVRRDRAKHERDHSFEHCERVHAALVRWYGACGFTVREVPRSSPGERAGFVLKHLAAAGA